ncbi:MAG: hypothetical protein QM669_07250 [Siphonobacter sp.]
MKTVYLFFILFLPFLSCKSKEEKAIQANLNELSGSWTITDFQVSGTAVDSLKTAFRQGTLTFNSCKYFKKGFQSEAVTCSGTAEINGETLSLGHRYFKDATPFHLSVNFYPGQNFTFSLLLSGTWEFVQADNQLTAKQISNENLPNLHVEFKASKQ